MWLFLPFIALVRGEGTAARPDCPMLLAGVVLGNGVTEEVLHPAFIFGRARADWHFWPAAVFGAVIFAAQHLYLAITIGVISGLASVLLSLLLAFLLAWLFVLGCWMKLT
ncbi:MAG: CPBP family glutamic-type intramembrane protease [Paracoccaceae bacterium]